MISLGTNAVGIGLVVRLRDQFTANANRISNQFNQLYGNANRVLKQNLVAARQVGLAMTIAGAAGTLAFRSSVNAAADFNYTLTGVRAATNATTEDMKKMHDQAILLGTQSKFTAIEVASAMEFLGKAGFEVTDIQKAIKGVTELGAAADMAIGGKEGAAGVMANILNTFGLAADRAEMISGMMARAAVKSSIDILDLAESIKYSGSVASTLQIPFQDLTAMISVLGNAGMRGSMAGVGLANMLMYLSKAVGPFRTKRQADALSLLGIHPDQLKDSKGNLLPMLEIVDLFARKMKSLPKTAQVSTLEGLMNIRGARAFVPLMRQTAIGMTLPEMLQDIMKNGPGAAKAMADMRMDTLKGDFMILSDTWHAFKIEVGETLGPIVRFGTQFVTKVVNKLIAFARTPIGKPIIILAAALSVATAIAGALLFAFTSIKLLTIASGVSFINMGRSLVWAWNSGTAAALRYAAAAKTANIVSTPWGLRGAGGRFVKGGGAATAAAGTGFFGTIRAAFGKMVAAVGGVTGALGWLGRALKVITGPVGWLVGIITAMFGFKNIIKMITYGLGTLLQSIMFVVDWVANIGKGPFDAYTIAKENFQKRNELLRKSMFGNMDSTPLVNNPSAKGGGRQYVGGEEKFEQLRRDMAASAVKKQEAKIYMDSVEVGKLILENQLAADLLNAKTIKD